jgi:hypothetical protein
MGRGVAPTEGCGGTRPVAKDMAICWQSGLGPELLWAFSPLVGVSDVVVGGAVSTALEVDGAGEGLPCVFGYRRVRRWPPLAAVQQRRCY